MEKHGEAYTVVRHVYDKSPGRSWRRLNSALHDTLAASITAHLSFLPEDFKAIHRDMNGGYWMGNSYGSTCGERYYNLACEVGHTPACIAFEQYAGRPAALWPEAVKTPERLHIGSEFTWEGLRLTVTDMRSNHLIACSYTREDRHGEGEELAEGDVRYFGQCYRTVERLVHYQDGALLVRMSPEIADADNRKPNRVVKIPYQALAVTRKASDAIRKRVLDEIKATPDPKALIAVQERLGAATRGTYRHFDIEDFRAAIQAKEKTFKEADVARVHAMSEAERLERWSAGENSGGWFSTVRLRVRGKYVETSTGHSVSLKSAKSALSFVLAARHANAKSFPVLPLGLEVDIHRVKRISTDGVLIGCTLIPWVEVERLDNLLKEAS